MTTSTSTDPQRRRLRAALLAVDAHSTFPGLAPALAPFAQPMAIDTSLAVIQQAPAHWRHHARTVAAISLARAAAAGSVAHERHLERLLGPEQARKIRQGPGAGAAAAHARHGKAAYGERFTQPGHAGVLDDVMAVLAPGPCPGTAGGGDGVTETPELSVDPRTMVTTARIKLSTHVHRSASLEQIAACVDPRAWATWPFWEAAYRVNLDGRGGFTRAPDEPAGQPWKGLFYEYVSWDGDPGVMSAYQNLLDITFAVDHRPDGTDTIDLRYHLYQCLGSLLLARLQEGGVDVDHGLCTVEVQPAGRLDGHPDCRALTTVFEKNVRFGDLLTRTTPGQGRAGTGLALDLMAPAVVGMWMHQLALGAVAKWRTFA
jgi:hypothetical protein